MFGSIEAEQWDIEEEERDGVEGEVSCKGEVFESFTEHGEGILCAVEEYGAGRGDGETSEGIMSAGDGDGDFSGELGFADLGVSAENADAALEPKGFDEPAIERGNGEDLADVLGVEGLNSRVHRHRGWHGRPPCR